MERRRLQIRQLEECLKIATLESAAEKAESEGDLVAAIAAYEELLALQPPTSPNLREEDAVRRGLQALGQFADGGPFAPGIAFHVQQQLILQGRDALGVDQIFGGAQEATQVVAEIGEVLEILLGQRACGGGHGGIKRFVAEYITT